MGNGHRVAYDLRNADMSLQDPGNGGSLSVDRNPAMCCFDSSGVETRYLENPIGAGLFLTLTCPSNTAYLAYNSDVDTVTIEEGQSLVMQSILCAGGVYEWLVLVTLSGDGSGGGSGSTNRNAGEDDLGDSTATVTVTLSGGLYDNKLVTLNAATVTITLDSDHSGYFGLTLEQDATGGRLVDFDNGTFIGSQEQPTAGASAKSHYHIFVSGSVYFVQRMG